MVKSPTRWAVTAPLLLTFAACAGGVTTAPIALPDGGQSVVVSEEQIDPSQPVRAIFETSAMQLHTLGTARVLFSFNETPAGVDGGVRVWAVSGTFEQHVYKHRHTIVQYRRSATQVTLSGSVPLGGELGTLTFSGTIANGTFTFSGIDKLGAVGGVTSRAGPYLTGPATVTAADERRTLSTGGCETTPPYLGTYAFGTTGPGWASAANPVSETNASVVLSSATNDFQGGYTFDGAFNGAVWGFSSTTAFGGPGAELVGGVVNVMFGPGDNAYSPSFFGFSWYMPFLFQSTGYAQLPSWMSISLDGLSSGDNQVTPCSG